MSDIVGYAQIKSDATTGVSAANISDFTKNHVRVLEFASDGGVLVVNPQGTALATFDKCDINKSFRCGVFSNQYITPPDLDFSQQMIYTFKLQTRKGGYNPVLREMVIMASLHKGEFNDDFLFQNQ